MGLTNMFEMSIHQQHITIHKTQKFTVNKCEMDFLSLDENLSHGSGVQS
jgi:hypothetical protein